MDSNFKMRRTVVGLRNKSGKFLVPKFSECILEFFEKDVNSVFVRFSVENGILILNEWEGGHELKHSPECPIKLNSRSLNVTEDKGKRELKTTNIGLATSVVIESSNSHILLTKRPAHMRASPNVWVFPGGHLELNETFFEAGAREVKEETGLDITTGKTSILGLWENVYPLFLGAGTPKYHILVVYLHTKLKETYEELTKKIIPEPSEVESYCWLNPSVLPKVFSADKNLTCDGKQYIFKNGKIVEKYLDYCTMFNKWLRVQSEPYSGVTFALRKWMESKSSEKLHSKY